MARSTAQVEYGPSGRYPVQNGTSQGYEPSSRWRGSRSHVASEQSRSKLAALENIVRRLLPLAIFVTCIIANGSAFGSTYFIAANGSDSNNGSSKTTPWLHAPGMPNCTGKCASTTPKPGDQFIFRGGDTWHFGNSSASLTSAGLGFGTGPGRAATRSTSAWIRRGIQADLGSVRFLPVITPLMQTSFPVAYTTIMRR